MQNEINQSAELNESQNILLHKLNNFRCSASFIDSFMRRHNLSYRLPTHKALQNNKPVSTKCSEALVYFDDLNKAASKYTLDLIYNMDETPMYYDLLESRTIDFVGSNSVDVVHSGNEKKRFTLVVTISADGRLLPFYLILRGLKNIPSVFKTNPLPNNIVLTVSESGTMTSELLGDYIERIIKPDSKNNPSLLVLDEFRAHYYDLVHEYLRKSKI